MYNFENILHKGGGSFKGRPPFAGRGKFVLAPNIEINYKEDIFSLGRKFF